MKNKNDSKLIILTSVIILVIIGLFLIFGYSYNKKVINNFEDCVKAGNPVMESYPRQCKADEKTFVEIINDRKLENVAELFREKAIEKSEAIPIEGFDPSLYSGVFLGLVDSDFDNTLAIGGVWKMEGGELKFVRDESQGITSADGTLTDEGIIILLNNLEKRLNLEVNTQEDFDRLIQLISQDENKFYCTPENRGAEACTFDYNPVCGYVQVECITTPCNPVKETFSNVCVACMNDRVLYFINGEC